MSDLVYIEGSKRTSQNLVNETGVLPTDKVVRQSSGVFSQARMFDNEQLGFILDSRRY